MKQRSTSRLADLFGLLVASFLLLLTTGCQSTQEDLILRLAVTTSTRDSGLLDKLVPVFERQTGFRVDIIAVGTGKALKLGEAGDVDAILVHSRPDEDAFLDSGHGSRREDVMYNTFLILGPEADPAEVRNLSAPQALQQIAKQQAKFVSRGDKSGTHQRELQLWEVSVPHWKHYIESGSGMGATLNMADQMDAYVLADRGTYLAMRSKLNLIPLVSEGDDLTNPYGAIVVNPDKYAKLNAQAANQFVSFLISPQSQRIIAEFTVDGEPLFYPLHETQ